MYRHLTWALLSMRCTPQLQTPQTRTCPLAPSPSPPPTCGHHLCPDAGPPFQSRRTPWGAALCRRASLSRLPALGIVQIVAGGGRGIGWAGRLASCVRRGGWVGGWTAVTQGSRVHQLEGRAQCSNTAYTMGLASKPQKASIRKGNQQLHMAHGGEMSDTLPPASPIAVKMWLCIVHGGK